MHFAFLELIVALLSVDQQFISQSLKLLKSSAALFCIFSSIIGIRVEQGAVLYYQVDIEVRIMELLPALLANSSEGLCCLRGVAHVLIDVQSFTVSLNVFGSQEKNCRKGRFSPSKLKGKRAIELGAGCGVAGLGQSLLALWD